MKTKLILLALLSAFSLQPSALLHAATIIDAANHHAYGANFGWLDWRGDTVNGAVIGEYICSGYIYSANVGWVNIGSGSPTNGIYYQNLSANDFGVNQDGLGNLRGFAYGANIGWVNFENNGAPKVDLLTGNFSGYIWSANCGWISLSNAVAYVQTDTIQQGALAPNGLPVAWLLANFGTTNVNANADPDHDGMSNQQEYLAGTNPNDGGDYLHVTSITRDNPPSTYTMLWWASKPTRFYAIQQSAALGGSSFADRFVLPFAGANNAGFDDTQTNSFYRIRAFRPLTP
jgi:hypothetical protein